VVFPIKAILSNSRNNQNIEEMDEGNLRRFLGYCTGFILFNHDPKSASYFVNAGMWVKQSYWGVISKHLPALLNNICIQEQLNILSRLNVEGIIFDEAWNAGYVKGLSDAQLWAESGKLDRCLDDI
jgi:hypothetical protein